MFLLNQGAFEEEEKLYVEDVFSAFTYTGTGAARSIVNGIDLAGEGGLTWIKSRGGASNHALFDTLRTLGSSLRSNAADAQSAAPSVGTDLTSFNSDGFSIGTNFYASLNSNTTLYSSWTFRKAKKFFDVVTYTGNGVAGRQIAHGLGTTPGMIIVKCLTTANDWAVWHRSAESGLGRGQLNSQNTFFADNGLFWGNGSVTTPPNDSVFTVGSHTYVNTNGYAYVAYIFAHDTSADGIIQCGSYTGTGSTSGGPDINLGWEPQFLLIKGATETNTNWNIFDTSRSLSLNEEAILAANASTAESSSNWLDPTSTGFRLQTSNAQVNVNTKTYVYMAIRKGLMRPPTDASKVFGVVARTGTGAAATVSAGSITTGVDLGITKQRAGTTAPVWMDRLRGVLSQLYSSSTAAQGTNNGRIDSFGMSGVNLGTSAEVNGSGSTYINYFLKQARGFFDIVAYTGTGVTRTVPHSLGVAPELAFFKHRDSSQDWGCFYGQADKAAYLSQSYAAYNDTSIWQNSLPTSSLFGLGTDGMVNASGGSYIAYLFASCPGVSKIGTYAGSSSIQNIDCGFAAGARFVMIKPINAIGSWSYWDSVRGIIAANDPMLLFENTAAEFTNSDNIDPHAAGFSLPIQGGTNNPGTTYLYLAIA